MNFFLALSATSKKAFEFVSGNVDGPHLRTTQRQAAKRLSPPFINLSQEDIAAMVTHHIQKFRLLWKNVSGFDKKADKMRVALSVGVDATALSQTHQIDFQHGAIVGGAYPNHFISTADMSKDEVVDLLKACRDGKRGPLAAEIKVAVVTIQNPPPGMSPYMTLVGRPQTINESNNFGQMGKSHDVITITSHQLRYLIHYSSINLWDGSCQGWKRRCTQ